MRRLLDEKLLRGDLSVRGILAKLTKGGLLLKTGQGNQISKEKFVLMLSAHISRMKRLT